MRGGLELFGATLAAGIVPAKRQADGTIVVEDVPIFSEIREADAGVVAGARDVRNKAWLARALEKHRARIAMGSAAPLTLRHAFNSPTRVGEYRLTRLDRLAVNPDESERWTLFGDLVFEDEAAFNSAKGYDQRSAEISMDGPDELAAVALLRDQVAHHRFPALRPELAEAFQAWRSSAPQVWANPKEFTMQTYEQSRAETFAAAQAVSDVSAADMARGGQLAAWALAYADGGEARAGVEKALIAKLGQQAAEQARRAWAAYVEMPTASGHPWVQRFVALFPTLAKEQTRARTATKPLPDLPESVDRGIGDRDLHLVPDGSRSDAPVEDDEHMSTAAKLAWAKSDLERLRAGSFQALSEDDPHASSATKLAAAKRDLAALRASGVDAGSVIVEKFEAAPMGPLGLDLAAVRREVALFGPSNTAERLRAAQHELAMVEARARRVS